MEYYASSIFRYNLVAIRDVEEAIEIGTALVRISVIERVNSTEGIIETIRKFAKVIKDKGERKEGILDLAKKMLAEKIDIDLISKLTGLRKEQFIK